MDARERRIALTVNEAFHDAEATRYAQDHPEIFDEETKRWKRMLEAYVRRDGTPRTFADIGCGTGFVSRLIARHLTKDATLIGVDISEAMLKTYAEAMRGSEAAHVECRKTSDERLPLEDESIDVLVMNSVLHHVPETATALRECERVLKPGGLLMIGHEPNAVFFRSSFLVANARVVHHFTPKRVAAAILKSLGLYGRVVKPTADVTLDRVNERLLEEKLIDRPLTRGELSAFNDIHSPTAGTWRRDRGFTADGIMALLPHCDLVTLETYNHLAKASWRSVPTRTYDRVLRFLAPRSGATLFLVARKRL